MAANRHHRRRASALLLPPRRRVGPGICHRADKQATLLAAVQIPKTAGEQDLLTVFSPFGEVESVNILKSKGLHAGEVGSSGVVGLQSTCCGLLPWRLQAQSAAALVGRASWLA